MRRTIIILTVLLIASTASAQLPYAFQCQHDEKQPLEVQLCSSLAAAMARNEYMTALTEPRNPYFHMIILPTARGGYLSVTIASSLIYPPLNGLALSAYLGGFIIKPGMLDSEIADEMIGRAAIGTAEWMIGAEEAINAIPRGDRPVGLMADLSVLVDKCGQFGTEVQTNE